MTRSALPRPLIAALASLAVADPMGQQAYEEHLRSAIRDLDPADWRFRDVRVRSLRSRDPGDRRVPLTAVSRAPAPLRRLVGRFAYGAPDLVHRLDLRLPRAPDAEVLTVHDVAPLHYLDEGTMPRGWEADARHARAVVVPSRFTATEVADRTGVEAHVIPHGHDPEVAAASPLDTDRLAALGIEGPFVLHAGGATRRKNLEGLAGAWRILRSGGLDATLVLCGPPDARRDEHFAGLTGTLALGRLDRRVFVRLLASAELVVVPSHYEGFGLPVLEAMTAGVPVVAADAGALPEVGAGFVRLAGTEAPELAGAIAETLKHPPGAELLAEARTRSLGFTWEGCAAAHLDVYRRALDSGA